ncbi:hypothetical protein RB1519 [Rhodopirellula baltica SH 1]|uniref:Uncharacterized protein n=1 Tax=Rhodopirellula baltica (strain DSM 10527 / NCIMB 13988 / SH1) TaxID=243090 RepID=Q7UX71_RHOBA|nr:hypothetical protein RB1519 [Rhodopirellula baltica SH 1]
MVFCPVLSFPMRDDRPPTSFQTSNTRCKFAWMSKNRAATPKFQADDRHISVAHLKRSRSFEPPPSRRLGIELER